MNNKAISLFKHPHERQVKSIVVSLLPFTTHLKSPALKEVNHAIYRPFLTTNQQQQQPESDLLLHDPHRVMRHGGPHEAGEQGNVRTVKRLAERG